MNDKDYILRVDLPWFAIVTMVYHCNFFITLDDIRIDVHILYKSAH